MCGHSKDLPLGTIQILKVRDPSEKLGLQFSPPQTKGIWHRLQAHSELVLSNVCECNTHCTTPGLQLVSATWAKQQTWDAKDINKPSHIPAEYSAYSAETLQAWSWWYCDLLPIWACLCSLHSMHTCHTGTHMLSGTLRSFRKAVRLG